MLLIPYYHYRKHCYSIKNIETTDSFRHYLEKNYGEYYIPTALSPIAGGIVYLANFISNLVYGPDKSLF